VVMDADLSHPPEAVPELVAALENPLTDFVIGSRYVRGGSTDEDWGILRFLNSKLATLLATPLTRAADPMAGFFGLRRETFEAAEQLNPSATRLVLS
jgi:dolichol-phosphate mannosyltransferase